MKGPPPRSPAGASCRSPPRLQSVAVCSRSARACASLPSPFPAPSIPVCRISSGTEFAGHSTGRQQRCLLFCNSPGCDTRWADRRCSVDDLNRDPRSTSCYRRSERRHLRSCSSGTLGSVGGGYLSPRSRLRRFFARKRTEQLRATAGTDHRRCDPARSHAPHDIWHKLAAQSSEPAKSPAPRERMGMDMFELGGIVYPEYAIRGED